MAFVSPLKTGDPMSRQPRNRIPRSNTRWRQFLVERGLATDSDIIRARLVDLSRRSDPPDDTHPPDDPVHPDHDAEAFE